MKLVSANPSGSHVKEIGPLGRLINVKELGHGDAQFGQLAGMDRVRIVPRFVRTGMAAKVN